MRVGIGYDAHRFGDARKNNTIRIGGVDIPSERSIVAHSDGDVVVHALCDAILGAAALGDIGRHFPDTDERWSSVDSLALLAACIIKVEERGLSFGNADITLVAQQPRVSGYIEEMCRTMAHAIGCPTGDVSVKATTTEGMGFEGRGEGVAAHAVVLLAG
ncbi:MAG: 2-C-methyl-D-erythritol 2,4-cyclodiphosphate synthase [Gammaproteobacteria bacterium]|nr:2-C-methyl-D-erythritol 2,4-cyclodiphosphate synthase [Gammaproteobacteria bacterium]